MVTLHLSLFSLRIQKALGIFILQKRNKTLQVLMILLLSHYDLCKTSQYSSSPARIRVSGATGLCLNWIQYVHIHVWYLGVFVYMCVYRYMYTYGLENTVCEINIEAKRNRMSLTSVAILSSFMVSACGSAITCVRWNISFAPQGCPK